MPAGDLRYQSIDDVLRWIDSAGASGALEIGRGEHALTIYFHAGRLTFADQGNQSPTMAELESAGIERAMWERALGRPEARSSVSASLLAEGVPRAAVEAFALRRIRLAVEGLRKLWAGRFDTTDAVHPFGTAASIDPSRVYRSPVVGNGDDRFNAIMALIPTDRFQVILNGRDWSALSELLAPFRYRDLVERLGNDDADHLFVTLQRAELAQIIPADLTVVPAEPAREVESSEPSEDPDRETVDDQTGSVEYVPPAVDEAAFDLPAAVGSSSVVDDEAEPVVPPEIDSLDDESATDDESVLSADLELDAVSVADEEMPCSVEMDPTGTVDLLDFVDAEAYVGTMTPDTPDESFALESATPAVSVESTDVVSGAVASVVDADVDGSSVDTGRLAPRLDQDTGDAVAQWDGITPMIGEPADDDGTGFDLVPAPDSRADAADTAPAGVDAEESVPGDDALFPELHPVDDQDLPEPGSGFPIALLESKDPAETDDEVSTEETPDRPESDIGAVVVSQPDESIDPESPDADEHGSSRDLADELDDAEGVDPPFGPDDEFVLEPTPAGLFDSEDTTDHSDEQADPPGPNLDAMLDDMMPLSQETFDPDPGVADRPPAPVEPEAPSRGWPEQSVFVDSVDDGDRAEIAASDRSDLDGSGPVERPEVGDPPVGGQDPVEWNGATRELADIEAYEHRGLRTRLSAVQHDEEADRGDGGMRDRPESTDDDSYGEGTYRLVADLRKQMDVPEGTKVSTLRRLIAAITRL